MAKTATKHVEAKAKLDAKERIVLAQVANLRRVPSGKGKRKRISGREVWCSLTDAERKLLSKRTVERIVAKIDDNRRCSAPKLQNDGLVDFEAYSSQQKAQGWG